MATGLKSYKKNDPIGGKQYTHDNMHTSEIEVERMQWTDDFLEGANALASTTISNVYWTGAGTNGTQAIIAGVNGIMQLDTSATGSSTSTLTFTTTDFDVANNPSMEVRIAVSAITNSKFELGFYATANDYLLFRFDSAVSATTLYVASNKNGAGEVATAIGVTVGADTYLKLRIDTYSDATYKLYVNNVEVEGLSTNVIRSLATFKPYFYIDNKTASASKKMNIDYVKLSQDRKA
jgi:hypothetical protein